MAAATTSASTSSAPTRTVDIFNELDPEPRLLMGPGPVDVYPRVLRAMSVPLQGQFDPQFTGYMNQVMALYRHVFRTDNHWTFLIDGSARAGIEACLVSLLEPGDRLLVPIFGRFGHLLVEIGQRVGAEVEINRHRLGHRLHTRCSRGRNPPASPQGSGDLPGRHVHHDAATTGRNRRHLPPQ